MATNLGHCFSVGVASTQGRRNYQEDSYAITDSLGSSKPFSELEQLVVALGDGVGGEVGGDVASRTAVNTFCAIVQQDSAVGKTQDILLGNGLAQANVAIAEEIAQDPAYTGMATTLVGALISLDSLAWVSVGDSHLFLLREGTLEKLNADHSLGALLDEQAQLGVIDQDEAASASGRNMLRSVVDGNAIDLIDSTSTPVGLKTGDRVLLASDGINTLSAQEIVSISDRQVNAQDFAEGLISAVESIGLDTQDNTLVVAIDLASPAEHPTVDETQDDRNKKLWPVLALLPVIGAGAYFGMDYFLAEKPIPVPDSIPVRTNTSDKNAAIGSPKDISIPEKVAQDVVKKTSQSVPKESEKKPSLLEKKAALTEENLNKQNQTEQKTLVSPDVTVDSKEPLNKKQPVRTEKEDQP